MVPVYYWSDEMIFDWGQTSYSPGFRHAWSDGIRNEASTGRSHPDGNFAIGSQHEVRYFLARKGAVFPQWPDYAAAEYIIIWLASIFWCPRYCPAGQQWQLTMAHMPVTV